MTLKEEWEITFPGKAFPKAGKITKEVLDWAASVVNSGKASPNQIRELLYDKS